MEETQGITRSKMHMKFILKKRRGNARNYSIVNAYEIYFKEKKYWASARNHSIINAYENCFKHRGNTMKSLDQLCIWRLFEINIEETQGITRSWMRTTIGLMKHRGNARNHSIINAYENSYKEASIKKHESLFHLCIWKLFLNKHLGNSKYHPIINVYENWFK